MPRIAKVRGRLSYDRVAQVKQVFKEFDTNNDKSMDAKEFGSCLKKLGLRLSDSEISDLMQQMDDNGTGRIELGEFIDWFPTLMHLHDIAQVRPARGVSLSNDVDWAELRRKLPYEKTPEAKKNRMEIYNQFDPNGNGYLSLAEVDKGMRDILNLYQIFDCKPVIMRAFQAARALNDGRNKPSSHGPDYIEKCEFRMLLWYIRQYFELWQMFSLTDASGDRRIDENEFIQAFDVLKSWGVKSKDPSAEFKKIDKNAGGILLFDEFAEWALFKGLDLQDDDD